MATQATAAPQAARDDRFFLWTAIAMALVVVAGFSVQLGMGRSSFAAPWPVHLHAFVFMGWVALYLAQTVLAANRSMRLHKRLGWIGAGWIVAMAILGTVITITMVRRGAAPFFFRPQQFLIFNPVSVLVFAGLSTAAIINRRRTDWHRRLHYCGMANLLGPAFGRLLPMPLLIPYAFEATFVAVMIFPLIGIAHDRRARRPVHPAWKWGIGTILLSMLLIELVTWSPLGSALYRIAVAGSPGAGIDPLAYPPFP